MTSKFVYRSMLISSLMEVFDGIAFSTVTKKTHETELQPMFCYVLFLLLIHKSSHSLGSMWCNTLGFNWRPRRGPPSICFHMLQYSQGIAACIYILLVSMYYLLTLLLLLFICLSPSFDKSNLLDHWPFGHSSWHVCCSYFFSNVFCYLQLPTYKRSSTLRSKLLYAISSNTGFELS